MCEFWLYGCRHAIRTPCPRPKPTPTTLNNTIGSGSGSNGSNLSSSTHSSPRRGSSNTSHSTDLTSTGPLSKFCNGFPLTPKATNAPCYNCILADAKRKIQLEKPEVDAKKEELRRDGRAKTIARGPDGRYVDEFGNKIIAEEEYEQDFGGAGGYGAARQRGFTAARGSANGNGNFGRVGAYGGTSGYARGEYGGVNWGQDRRNTVAAGVFSGNGGFRGRGGGSEGLASGFRPRQIDNYNNISGNGSSYQTGGGATIGFGPLVDFPNQPGGYQSGYGQQQQQRFTNDFGGQAWGMSGSGGGGLGHGLDNGIYQQSANQFNTNNPYSNSNPNTTNSDNTNTNTNNGSRRF